MADNGEKLDKDDILTTQSRRIVFNEYMQGKSLKEAAKTANLGFHYVHKWVNQSLFYPLARQEQAKIAEKAGITVAYCQQKFLELADVAAKKGKLGVARACIADLCKTIGGFQSDAPNPKALRAKELDTEKAKALRQAAEWYYNRKYLASKPGSNSDEITEVDWTQNDTVSGLGNNQNDPENQASFSSEKQGEV